jgi:hypothetical protein
LKKLLISTETVVLILAKNGLGFILGNFFKNSSGHPVRYEEESMKKRIC